MLQLLSTLARIFISFKPCCRRQIHNQLYLLGLNYIICLNSGKTQNYIVTILHLDVRYAENMRQLSIQFRDRPMTPLETAIYWTEYVIRNKGAHFLKPASVDLPFYQYLLLDVIAVLAGSLTVFLWLLYLINKYTLMVIFNRIRISNSSQIKKTN